MLTPTISRAMGGVDTLIPIVDDYMKIRMGEKLSYFAYVGIQHRLALNYCLTVQ